MLQFLTRQIQKVGNLFTDNAISMPPGVLDRYAFLSRCTGCLTCTFSCPFDSISYLQDRSGHKLPFLDTANRACHLCHDMPCATSCPSHAVTKVPETWVDMGTSNFDSSACLNSQGIICKMCYFACPLNDIALQWDDDTHLPSIDSSACSGCGNCRDLCPTEAFSIQV